jgi:hypothetical protein
MTAPRQFVALIIGPSAGQLRIVVRHVVRRFRVGGFRALVDDDLERGATVLVQQLADGAGRAPHDTPPGAERL